MRALVQKCTNAATKIILGVEPAALAAEVQYSAREAVPIVIAAGQRRSVRNAALVLMFEDVASSSQKKMTMIEAARCRGQLMVRKT
jgi:hypothetical protein